LIFKNYRVPRDNLLDKFSQVSADGVFTSNINSADKRFGVQLGSLSGGRIVLSLYASQNAIMALAIGVRYSCIRRQFSQPGND
jgi:acyl-CoA oxidase